MKNGQWWDVSWNPITGCTPVSGACENCWAANMVQRFPQLHSKYGHQFRDIQFHSERLERPLHWKKPRRIFVCSMGDLFHEEIQWYQINKILSVMAEIPRHIYIMLTKRPERALQHFEKNKGIEKQGWGALPLTQDGKTWPLANVWLGVTAETQQRADERIPILLQIPAAVRFVSIEPMLGPVDLTRYLGWPLCYSCSSGSNGSCQYKEECPEQYNDMLCLDWVIVGGETGPRARPMHPEWVWPIRDQCQVAGVPFFFKSWGRGIKSRLLDEREWNEFPS